MKILFLLILISCFSYAQSIQLDGKISSDEWTNSTSYEFYGGEKILIKTDDQFVYVAVDGEKGGFSSLGIFNKDTVYILHASTGLITAKYVKNKSEWIQEIEFRTSLQKKVRKLKNETDAQMFNMLNFKWASNRLKLKGPEKLKTKKHNVIEYKISKSLFDHKEPLISIVYYQHFAKIKYAKSSFNLNDGSTNKAMVKGENVRKLKFDKRQWLKIKL